MIINKVLNNNVVTIISENSEEAVVMGRGIAFQKKKGDEIDESKIEKIFVLENKSINEKLLTLVNDIPAKYLEVAENIIKYAENKLGTKLNENIYLTLTDHISFAISRAEKNLEIKNAMLWDIKRLHKINEFSCIQYNINIRTGSSAVHCRKCTFCFLCDTWHDGNAENVFRIFMNLISKVVLDDGSLHLLRRLCSGKAVYHVRILGF